MGAPNIPGVPMVVEALGMTAAENELLANAPEGLEEPTGPVVVVDCDPPNKLLVFAEAEELKIELEVVGTEGINGLGCVVDSAVIFSDCLLANGFVVDDAGAPNENGAEGIVLGGGFNPKPVLGVVIPAIGAPNNGFDSDLAASFPPKLNAVDTLLVIGGCCTAPNVKEAVDFGTSSLVADVFKLAAAGTVPKENDELLLVVEVIGLILSGTEPKVKLVVEGLLELFCGLISSFGSTHLPAVTKIILLLFSKTNSQQTRRLFKEVKPKSASKC